MNTAYSSLDLCALERPGTFDSIVGQTDLVKNIRNQSKRDRFFQVFILEGQFGSGKTTIARIIAKAVNCRHKDEQGNPCGTCPDCLAIQRGQTVDIIEMDAASNTGIDAIRALKETVAYMPVSMQKKVYIIDEVHKLSDGAFNALLKVLEEPPAHTMFILCTTDAQKIPATVRSRAACYHFGQIRVSDIVVHLTSLAKKYQLPYEEEGLFLIAKNAQGSMRNALKLLEQSAQSENGVTTENVRSMLGLTDPADVFSFVKALATHATADAIKKAQNLFTIQGKSPLALCNDALSICADAVTASVAGLDSIVGTEYYMSSINELISGSRTEDLFVVTNGLMELLPAQRRNVDEAAFICGLVKMSISSDSMLVSLQAEVSRLTQKVEQLEKGMPGIVADIKANKTVSIPDMSGCFHSTTAATMQEHPETEYVEEPALETSQEANNTKKDTAQKEQDNMIVSGIGDITPYSSISAISQNIGDQSENGCENTSRGLEDATDAAYSEVQSIIPFTKVTQMEKSEEPATDATCTMDGFEVVCGETPFSSALPDCGEMEEAATVSETRSEEEKKEPKKTMPQLDPFELLSIYGFSSSKPATDTLKENTPNTTNARNETEEMQRQQPAVERFSPQIKENSEDHSDKEAVQNYLDDAYEDALFENILELGFERKDTPQGTEFHSKNKVFLRMAKAYEKTLGAFPFRVS